MVKFKELQEKINKMQDKINKIENDIFEILINNKASHIESIIAMQNLIKEIREDAKEEQKLKGDNNNDKI